MKNMVDIREESWYYTFKGSACPSVFDAINRGLDSLFCITKA